MRICSIVTACLCSVFILTACNYEDRPATTAGGDRDNTGVNARDRDGSNKTPIDQNENKKDVDLTARIRREIVDTKMSVNAQNVKVITQDGRVTLRGPVKNVEEKERIHDIAADIAGAENVDDQLEVEVNP
jgi:hyperosmotically inducible periplasmic protein